jgi:phage-related protein
VAASVGAAFIKIAPNLQGFHRTITKELKGLGPQIQKIGLGLGRNLGDGIRRGLGDPLSGPLEESSKKQRQKSPKQGEQVAGAFASGFQKRLKAAFQSLPKAKIDADSSEADKKVAELRGRLEALSGKTVGVDIDAGAAIAELAAVKGELEALGRSESVQVRVDAAAAIVELEAVQAQVDRLDHDDVNVKVDTRGAITSLTALGASISTVSIGLAGLAAIPVAATLGVGILSLVGPLGAAAAGFGGLAAVAVPAISDITKAQQAQQAAQQAANGTAAQAKAANDKLAASMRALSPAERDLLKGWTGLQTAFKGWARNLQPEVLPLFTRGINLVKSALPSLTPIVRGAAGAVDGLLARVQAAAKSPFWQQMKTNLTSLVPASITGFGTAAGNVVTGLAGVVNAFLPYAPQILSFVTRITAAFARWGQGLGTSSGFAQFIAYVKANLPLVLHTLTQLVTTVGHVVASLAPLGPVALGAFGLLLRFVSFLKPGEIQAIAIAFTVLSVAVWAVNFALEANPIVLVITGIIALVAAVVLAYNHVTWFHNAVVAAWNGIKTVALFVWNSILEPVFSALVIAVQAVGTAAVWLWRTVLVPAFNAISLAARIMFAVVATLVLLPLVIAFNLAKAAVLAFWHLAIVPAFNGAKVVVAAAWAVIKPIFDLWVAGVKLLGSAATWLWHTAVVPAWNGIKAAISATYNATIKPVLSALNSLLRNVIGPVFKWIYSSVIKPMWSAAGSVIRSVWSTAISPAFNALKTGVNAVKNSFSLAVKGITTIWKGLESATKKPVQFVVNTVYNNGIRNVWNKVAGLVHLPPLPAVKFATGGIFPGYTPGRDPYTMPMAAFSGGEAVMRPEFTRAVGSDFVYSANAIAARQGVGGIRDWLANGDLKFARGGIMPGRTVTAFSDGGIIGGILGAVKHAGSLVVHGASSILDAGASAFAKHALDPILSRIPGADSTWARAIYSLPKRMIDGFVGWLKSAIDPKLGGDGHGVVAAAKKYIGIGDDRGPNNNIFSRAWGMPGAPWCAMFVSTAIKDAHAQKYYSGYPTALAAGYDSMKHVSSGRGGDLATYNGGGHINIIEKPAGGSYMTIGGNQNALVQRGIRSPQVILRPGFASGGILGREAQRMFKVEAPRNADPHETQTPLVQLMRSLPTGQMGSVARAIVSKHLQVTSAGVYDDGGVVPPGLNLIANASRKPEALLSSSQWDAITSATSGGDTYNQWTVIPQRAEISVRDLEAMQTRQEIRQRVGRPS